MKKIISIVIMWIQIWCIIPLGCAENTKQLCVAYLPAHSAAIELFSSRHPDVALISCDVSFWSQEEFITRILTQDASVDIYSITVSMGLGALKDKNYLPAINSEYLEKEVINWFPPIVDCISANGQLVAVPYDLYTNEWGMNSSLWEKVCPDRSIDTWIDYIDLVRWWYENLGLEDDFNVSYAGLRRDDILRNILYSYVSLYETETQPINFDTSEFRLTLSQLMNLPNPENSEDEEEWNEMINRPSLLLETPENIGSQTYNHDFDAIPEPRFVSNQSPCLRGEMQLYVINPYTKNYQEAVWFLEALIEAMPDTAKIRLSPNIDIPIENPYWVTRHEQLTEQLDRLLSNKANPDSLDEEDTIERLQRQLQDASDRYIVTTEEYRRYQELVQYLHFNEYSLFLGFQNGENIDILFRIITRYFHGLLTIDECICSLNNIAEQLFYESY